MEIINILQLQVFFESDWSDNMFTFEMSVMFIDILVIDSYLQGSTLLRGHPILHREAGRRQGSDQELNFHFDETEHVITKYNLTFFDSVTR